MAAEKGRVREREATQETDRDRHEKSGDRQRPEQTGSQRRKERKRIAGQLYSEREDRVA